MLTFFPTWIIACLRVLKTEMVLYVVKRGEIVETCCLKTETEVFYLRK